MEKTYFGLSYDPFDKRYQARGPTVASSDFTEMIQRLNYLKDMRGIGLITARPGMGKSFGLRCFAEALNPSQYSMRYITLTTVNVNDFYRQFCGVLGIGSTGKKPRLFQEIQDRVWYLYREKKQPLILAVDEAQYLSDGILNDLKILMNHQYDSINCFTLILCGEPVLNTRLSRPEHEALRQRIVVHYNFRGLYDDELKAYISEKITAAGGDSSIIDEAVLPEVEHYSGGSPRMIDNLLSYALKLAGQLKKDKIDLETIRNAADAQLLG